MLHYKFHQSQQNSKKLLIMLHGFISDQSTFDEHLETMSEAVNILTVDLPGHGQDASDKDKVWDFDFICNELNDTLANFTDYQIYLHGYSMGGRIALYYALNGVVKLQGLLLESTSPGLQEDAARTERQQVDFARAKVLDIAGLEIFVNDWEKLPLFYTQYDLDKELKKQIREMRLSQDPTRLAKALRDYGTGVMPNLWPMISQITTPTCIIVGELDKKFCKIAESMKQLIPQSDIYDISKSGHTVHVEQQQEFDKIVLGFIHKEEQND
ncbi:2-succinyl-6-hydroxy-2,4-cyclohexadiene-1-carboxylate synthase [Staphylococcus gallinarum]|uniref:2-succinyl-6-hydroxy-2, 4-cyclohexadiene-1-carboxylate synthase n=1 Tax=Staphylococcus gallinarum TaxID=1293 RepID=UPI002DB60D57|nr:2-succinyl-6-hydroxy-2,4-cyclohexadiene-1-carboxylate synthase [Staphylococcus gallinarum]MEB6242240.1 2-succinyl-6-hydroxy-2,4-cyclohexadiene-1-carboxylate synthase [Staphylococcus gallinarum]MEB6295417.1 2-succinyl-6-hydroxy-2,4-cyclohexadiene-1-carboxylate synthase [Staphylococcus gallinarum]